MTRVLMTIGSWFLAGILAYSAVDKMLNWGLFMKALALYRVIPAIFLPALGYAVPAVELMTALAIVIPWLRHRGLSVAAWLLAAFTVMIGYAAVAAPGIPCGCSFTLGVTRATPGHVALNLILTGLAWALATSSIREPRRTAAEGVV